MAQKPHSNFNYGQYDCSLEKLNARNQGILFWFAVGIGWAFLFFSVLEVQWFAEAALTAQNEMSTSTITMGTLEMCEERGLEPDCEIREVNGAIWWSLLAVLLVSIGAGPLAIAAIMLTYRTKDVTKKWRNDTMGLLLFGLPVATIWALLWLVCLPYTWTLLPWGDWSTNWWKIFPFLFGLIWLGGLPLLFAVSAFIRKVFSPEYTYDVEQAEEEAQKEQETAQEDARTDGTATSIEIIEANPKKPVRFRIMNPPSHNDAWVGLYGKGASNEEHSNNWRWLRDVDVNDVSLPSVDSLTEGEYSLRTFSDGGYNLHSSHEFEIQEKPEVWMKEATIQGEKLHGYATDHPKLGKKEITTSSIISQQMKGPIHHIETKNTLYLIHENDMGSSVESKETAMDRSDSAKEEQATKKILKEEKEEPKRVTPFWDTIE